MSAKVKLMSVISLFILMLGVVILGVLATGPQTIHLDGSVNFNVGDKSLYVKDVRLQEDMSSDPVSLKETGRFMPGYINETLNMSLGEGNINSYGSIMLYFDVINTVDSTGNSNMYTASATTTQSEVTVSAIVDNTQGYIPSGTVAPEEITSTMSETATIIVTISGTEGTTVDLSQITITLTIKVLEVYDFTFTISGDTATLATYTGEGGDVVIPSTFSTRVVDGQTQYIEGNDYTVTAIAAGTSSNGPFYSACSTLTSITIPETITSIGNYAFYNCTSLTEINFNATAMNDLSFYNYVFDNAGQNGTGIAVNIGANVTKIPANLFAPSGSFSVNITSVNFEEGSVCESIGNSFFNYNNSLTSITIPDSVKSIGSQAFYNCTNLKTVTIGMNVTSIGYNAFYYCSSLTTITVNATTPPTLGSNAIPSNVTNIYVPSASVSRYRSASVWSSFSSKISAIV